MSWDDKLLFVSDKLRGEKPILLNYTLLSNLSFDNGENSLKSFLISFLRLRFTFYNIVSLFKFLFC